MKQLSQHLACQQRMGYTRFSRSFTFGPQTHTQTWLPAALSFSFTSWKILWIQTPDCAQLYKIIYKRVSIFMGRPMRLKALILLWSSFHCSSTMIINKFFQKRLFLLCYKTHVLLINISGYGKSLLINKWGQYTLICSILTFTHEKWKTTFHFSSFLDAIQKPHMTVEMCWPKWDPI